MVTFELAAVPGTQTAADGGMPRFRVPARSVLVAGSRHGHVDRHVCADLVQRLGTMGFGFYVGCASGVDACFRSALSHSRYRSRSVVACAFGSRVRTCRTQGLYASVVVPPDLSAKAALYRRTLWMVDRCSMAVLFPTDPQTGAWGKGSRLVFRSCVYHLKPLFVVGARPPESAYYDLYPDRLLGVVDGFWVVPHRYADGTCTPEY